MKYRYWPAVTNMLGYHFLSVFKIKQLKWLPVNFLPIIQYTGASFQSCLQFRIFEGSSIAILAEIYLLFYTLRSYLSKVKQIVSIVTFWVQNAIPRQHIQVLFYQMKIIPIFQVFLVSPPLKLVLCLHLYFYLRCSFNMVTVLCLWLGFVLIYTCQEERFFDESDIHNK